MAAAGQRKWKVTEETRLTHLLMERKILFPFSDKKILYEEVKDITGEIERECFRSDGPLVFSEVAFKIRELRERCEGFTAFLAEEGVFYDEQYNKVLLGPSYRGFEDGEESAQTKKFIRCGEPNYYFLKKLFALELLSEPNLEWLVRKAEEDGEDSVGSS